MRFYAIDVETANSDMASICQIGLAEFDTGKLGRTWKSYIDPDDYFSGFNVNLHGIDETTVAGAPRFDEIAEILNRLLHDQVVVTHTHFDRVAVKQACAPHNIAPPSCAWLDSACVARRAWPQFKSGGYGLSVICKNIGHEFQHHDALEDAIASAHILLAAMAETGLDLDGWLQRVEKPINPKARNKWLARVAESVNPDGVLYGEVLVFTGALELPREHAAELAAQIGIQVGRSVNKKTTLLVVGDQDLSRLAGHEKSSKHRRAEELIAKGQPLRIIRETDFKQLVATAA